MNYGLKEVMPSPPERQHHKTVAELSRTDLRRRQATILPRPADAAKRCRLERIVRRQATQSMRGAEAIDAGDS